MKLLNINIFTYAIRKLGEKINQTFLKISSEITEERVDEIIDTTFKEKK